MKIGPWQLTSNLLLAPMAGVTDLPFRNLCRRFGAGLAVSEMITADTSLWGSRKTLTRLDHEGEASPVAVQILGTEPRAMAEAARRNVDLGAQIIDINMGCPAKKVCRKAAGSALLRDEPKVARILEAVVTAVEVPVTLKIRTGWDAQHRNAVRIARIAEASGIQLLTVHGRTRACRFSGQAEYETIRQVKQTVAIPVVANGDIDGEEKAARVLKFTGADAIMIGRAAQGRPWIFRQIGHYLAHGSRLPPPSPRWIGALLLEHLDAILALHGMRHGVRIARKHIAWYSREMDGGADFRRRINAAETADEQRRLIETFFLERPDATTGLPRGAIPGGTPHEFRGDTRLFR
jgi:tRNA-dihydrouridine synthase B